MKTFFDPYAAVLWMSAIDTEKSSQNNIVDIFVSDLSIVNIKMTS